ncbi:cell filamentation protein [Nocardioides sp. YR527]|uniref:Fic/DOC family protein n=1 Tax=Nocardioides sp. YR527 TaxID=1881028 RepID=UPI00088844F7|nr:Fic family protein [Nocardioides sp. YR527]SDL33970.1 cell filamentation protein [Nocardioides sp. YR527]
MSPTWESYLYPETMTDGITGTLRNIPGYRDYEELQAFEYDEALDREIELRTGQVDLPRTYDSEHLRAIHRHLFGNVYEWAGEYRGISIQKDATHFADPTEIDDYLSAANKIIADADWATLDHKGFADVTSEVYANINQAHPFREGNGRAGKVFMSQVAELSHFRISYDPQRTGITAALWNQQSMLSAPDFGQRTPDPAPLRPIFYALAQPATDGPSQTVELAWSVRAHRLAGERSMPDILNEARGDLPESSPSLPHQELGQSNAPRRAPRR